MTAQLDRAVAITAIISAAAVLISVVIGLVLVARSAGDVGAFALAIGTALGGLTALFVKLRPGSGKSGGA